jgi:hypothetical protein
MKRYLSIDALQNALVDGAFSHAVDKKKAAGRALGTFVEIISFYLLKSWGLGRFVAIERGLQEFANPAISHNVEFSLHDAVPVAEVQLDGRPYSAKKIVKAICGMSHDIADAKPTGNVLLGRDGLLKNACTVAEADDYFVNAVLERHSGRRRDVIKASRLSRHPLAMFECKRVGVEAGQKKGPQTIEKAKQGAYVARAVSALQRVRRRDGSLAGFIEQEDGSFASGDYYKMLDEIVSGGAARVAPDFTLTVGIVSNHGNWFTSGNRNKELEVLAQSYDWLLFLTDDGLARFINDVVFPAGLGLPNCGRAFWDSYGEARNAKGRRANRFTKSMIDISADEELTRYFRKNAKSVAGWFNLISPAGRGMEDLKSQLADLMRNHPGKEQA